MNSKTKCTHGFHWDLGNWIGGSFWREKECEQCRAPIKLDKPHLALVWLYQLIWLLALWMVGSKIFNYDYSDSDMKLLASLFFVGFMIVILPAVDILILNHGTYHETLKKS